MRTVIFDLDGTLADTAADLIAAANHCFTAAGHDAPLDPVDDALTAFRGGRAMLRLGFERVLDGADTEAEVERWYQPLLDRYAEALAVHTTLYPGAMEAVAELTRRGFRVGICTNKPAALAEALLERLEVRHAFGAMIGADTLPVRKPDAAPYIAAVEAAGGTVARSLLVGDTETDRETARAAGVPCVLVSFGPEGAGISRLEPEAMLDHYAALPDLVEELLPAQEGDADVDADAEATPGTDPSPALAEIAAVGGDGPGLEPLVRGWRREMPLAERLDLARALWSTRAQTARIAAAKLLTQARIREDEAAVWDQIIAWLPEHEGTRLSDALCTAGEKRLAAEPARVDQLEPWVGAAQDWTRRAAIAMTLPAARAAHPDAAQQALRARVLGWLPGLLDDAFPPVRKAASAWLRALSRHDPDAVRDFLARETGISDKARAAAARFLPDA